MKYNESDFKKAHNHSFKSREEISKSIEAACFYCGKIFNPSEIKEWIDDGLTAICPYCGVDSVIGDNCGYDLNAEFLKGMRHYWFEK